MATSSVTTQATAVTAVISSLTLKEAPAIPCTPAEILATSKPVHRSLARALRRSPIPAGKDYGSVDVIKQFAGLGVARQKEALVKSRPRGVCEEERFVEIPPTNLVSTGWRARCIVAYPREVAAEKESVVSPLVVLYHGGGNCVGIPESELSLARCLVQRYHAVVVLPSYRLAPEHRFPVSTNDAWEVTKAVAAELRSEQSSRTILTFPEAPHIVVSAETSRGGGFVVGGTSAGAGHACSISFLARKQKLEPCLTGQYLSCGAFLPPASGEARSWNDSPIFDQVPQMQKYRDVYLSQQQNVDAPILDPDMLQIFRQANAADHGNGMAYCFNYLRDQEKDKKNVFQRAFEGLPPVYFQVAGLDLARDDSLVYERILREEGTGVKTRLDLYKGLDHAWWAMPAPYCDLDVSRKRMNDAVEGIGWLLR